MEASMKNYRSDNTLFTGVEIGLLIGINCIRAIKPKEIISGGDDKPYAQRTILGWGIVGATDLGTSEWNQ